MLSRQERRALRETVRDLLRKSSGEADVRRVMALEDGIDEELARRLGEVGAPSAAIPEECGGLGASYADLAVVLEETGRALACVPLLSSVHAIALLNEVRSRTTPAGPAFARASDLLAAVAAAEARVAVVHDQPRPGTRTAADPDGAWELHGIARYVVDGHLATHLLVPAETNHAGTTLFLVDATSPAVRRAVVETLDQTRRLAEVTFAHVPATPLASGEDAERCIRNAQDVAAVALAVECVGGAESVLAMTIEYARTRVQFGRPIGSFQAVKHHCADMLGQLELARTAAGYACGVLDDAMASAADRERASLLAMLQCADAFYTCALLGLQVHGGIGFTWEHPLHLYLKRAKSAQHLYGDTAAARARLAALLGLAVPA